MATTTATTTTSTCQECGDELPHGDGLCDCCRDCTHECAFDGGAR